MKESLSIQQEVVEAMCCASHIIDHMFIHVFQADSEQQEIRFSVLQHGIHATAFDGSRMAYSTAGWLKILSHLKSYMEITGKIDYGYFSGKLFAKRILMQKTLRNTTKNTKKSLPPKYNKVIK